MQRVVAQLLADVEAGDSFSNALSKHPKIFGKTYIALVKSGEVGGVLDAVLLRLADNLEKQQEFGSKVKGALIYPVIIVVGMVLVSAIMMIFVIPKLLSLYSDFNATLPLPTKILIGMSSFFVKYWFIVLALGGIALYVLRLYKATPEGRRKIDELIFKIPVYGELQRQIILTELTRTLSMMVGAGVSILESLHITSEVVGNTLISDALIDAANQVEKGFPVSISFSESEFFPPVFGQMIAVGEETGKLDEVLEKLDVVGAAVHSHFNLSREEQTKRVIRAMENPHVDIIFHLTTRVIQKREPILPDIDAIIKAAKRTGTVLEIDAYPERLDIRDEYVRRCVAAGVKMSIDSDAHSIQHFKYLEVGIAQARRGWATRNDIVNAWPLEKMRKMLKAQSVS